MAKTHPAAFSWEIRVNTPRTWRQRVAGWLHVLAHRVDGREVMAIEVQSDPALTINQTRRVLLAGFRATRDYLEFEVREEAIDRLLRHQQPQLFRRASHGQDQ